MKLILEKLKDKGSNKPIQDVIKLRLRGKGSGYKEGPDKWESSEPLHLCISSKFYKKYTEACQLVEALLNDIYWEFNNYLVYNGKQARDFKITRIENNPASYFSSHPEYSNE